MYIYIYNIIKALLREASKSPVAVVFTVWTRLKSFSRNFRMALSLYPWCCRSSVRWLFGLSCIPHKLQVVSICFRCHLLVPLRSSEAYKLPIRFCFEGFQALSMSQYVSVCLSTVCILEVQNSPVRTSELHAEMNRGLWVIYDACAKCRTSAFAPFSWALI